MTLQDYYEGVLENVPTANTLNYQVVYNAINRARRRMAAETDATLALYNFTLTPNVWNYPYSGALVAGCSVISVRKVWLYIGTTREKIPKVKKFDYFYTNFSSWPVKWWVEGNSVYYWPNPAEAYQSDWQVAKQPVTLATLADVDNEIPFQYTDAAIFLASKYTAITDGNSQLADFFEQEYQRAMALLPRNTL